MREALDRGPHSLSVLSYWEVLIKTMKGKLDVGNPRQWWVDTLDQRAARALRPEHAADLYGLAPIHEDPFDRMLMQSPPSMNSPKKLAPSSRPPRPKTATAPT